MENQEIWKEIKGFEGLYEVSNLGRVRSLDRYIKHWRGGVMKLKGQIMKFNYKYNNKENYILIHLSKNGKNYAYSLHRLVAEAFIPNPDNKPIIDHINGIRTDNRVNNLRWCTQKENANNPITISKHINGKKSKKVNQYTLDGILIKTWPSASEITRQAGYSTSLICSCCRGEYKSVYGYNWSYVN